MSAPLITRPLIRFSLGPAETVSCEGYATPFARPPGPVHRPHARADKQEPRILFLGDSITYGGNWTVYVESAIRAQKGMARATIVNMGLSSETTSGLSEPGHAGGAFPASGPA